MAEHNVEHYDPRQQDSVSQEARVVYYSRRVLVAHPDFPGQHMWLNVQDRQEALPVPPKSA